ncbi:MAG: thiamine diphosphokinase, partial [Anaerolineales bacterium]|nr:thiamine diphosphokinase [Anaerolineales bacterium]
MAQNTYTLVFANGELNDGPAVRAALESFARSDPRLIIAADGGLRYAARFGLHPDVLIGDLDSVPEAAIQAAQDAGALILRHKVEKDETDLELALIEAVQR